MSEFPPAPNQHILNGAHNTTIGQAVFNNVGRDQQVHQNCYSGNLLWDVIADVGASHDSEIQVERGRCLPGTREAVLDLIRIWKASECQDLPVCWLSGAAGVGKSAIALTIAEEWEKNGLVASFFFFRSDPKRNNPSSLILSIAHGLTVTRPHLKPLVNQIIADDPRILKARLEDQYKKLVLDSLSPSSSQESCLELGPVQQQHPPGLVIIDGLDECSNDNVQQRILSIIFSTYQQPFHSPPPLQFLICSRPESWIQGVFNSHIPYSLTRHIRLDDSFRPRYDIELYFHQQFQEIRRDPQYINVVFPTIWPSTLDVWRLIQKADGQFIYASTVIEFVKTKFTLPTIQLQIILDKISNTSSIPSTQSPFNNLDELYHMVLCANPDQDNLLPPILAAILIFHMRGAPSSPAFIELVLGLPTGMVAQTLHAMHSLLNIGGQGENILIYHTSFSDFLFDSARSREFFIDKSSWDVKLACHWIRVFTMLCKNNPDLLKSCIGSELEKGL